MKGTSFSVTEAMRFSPPTMTRAARTMSTTPVTTGGMEKDAFMLAAMELIWLMLPMPKLARTQKQLNSTASTAPICLQPL